LFISLSIPLPLNGPNFMYKSSALLSIIQFWQRRKFEGRRKQASKRKDITVSRVNFLEFIPVYTKCQRHLK
jgi:hypothetical protein